MLPAIFSCESDVIGESEFKFFRESDPQGFIVFTRNCRNIEQLYRLTSQLKESLGRDCPILVDQEGGRVERLKGGGFRENNQDIKMPSMLEFGLEYAQRPEETSYKLAKTIEKTAKTLKKCGINVNCAPVLDVLPVFEQENSLESLKNTVIGDRSFGYDVDIVTELGKIVCSVYLENGITPVIKHMIGHGKLLADSHKELPVSDIGFEEMQKSDFVPFVEMSKHFDNNNLWGMSAHVIYKQLDEHNVATLSPFIIRDIIRNNIGFSGFLLSDDISMNALQYAGSIEQRAVKAIDAGCDAVLYCAGKLGEMEKIANAI